MDGLNYGEQAGRLSSMLGLPTPPIAIAFTADPPEGVAHFDGQVPSTCSLWREAEKGVFYADPQAHANCAVGAYVMGFPMTDDVGANLQESLGLMAEVDYFGQEEPAAMPAMPAGETAGILYGPLGEFPLDPDVVLLWVTPAEAMVVSEAAGSADWRVGGARVVGRPGCAALPLAQRDGQTAISFGCIGMRTFTGIAGERALVAVPGDGLDEFVARLGAIVEANEKMRAHYESKKAELGAATG